MVLELEQLEQPGLLVRGGHELELPVGVGQEQADRGDVDEFGGADH